MKKGTAGAAAARVQLHPPHAAAGPAAAPPPHHRHGRTPPPPPPHTNTHTTHTRGRNPPLSPSPQPPRKDEGEMIQSVRRVDHRLNWDLFLRIAQEAPSLPPSLPLFLSPILTPPPSLPSPFLPSLPPSLPFSPPALRLAGGARRAAYRLGLYNNHNNEYTVTAIMITTNTLTVIILRVAPQLRVARGARRVAARAGDRLGLRPGRPGRGPLPPGRRRGAPRPPLLPPFLPPFTFVPF